MMERKHRPKPPEGVEQTTDQIGLAAGLVGELLRSRRCTIRVTDCKTKFAEIRVYCYLGDDELVRKKWRDEGNEGDPDEEFTRKCLLDDCWHYRDSYKSVMAAIPSAWRSLYDGADWTGLLQDSREGLDELLDSDFYSGVPRELENDREALYKACHFRR